MQLAVPSPANNGWDLFLLAPRNPRLKKNGGEAAKTDQKSVKTLGL